MPTACTGTIRGCCKQAGDLGLELKPLECPRVERGGQGQNLEGDRAAQRDLLGLVNHPHAAAGDLADDPEVAEDLAPLRIARARHRLGRRRPRRPG